MLLGAGNGHGGVCAVRRHRVPLLLLRPDAGTDHTGDLLRHQRLRRRNYKADKVLKCTPAPLICCHNSVGLNTCTGRSTSVVSSSHVPAPPLLNDPLPVVNHFLGQPNYPAQGAGGGDRGSLEQLCSSLAYACTVDLRLTFRSLCWDKTVPAGTRRDSGRCRHSQTPASRAWHHRTPVPHHYLDGEEIKEDFF